MTTEAVGNDSPSATRVAQVSLADRFQIDLQAPLPSFERPSAQAFAAHDRSRSDRQLFALVCSRGLPFRGDAANLLRRIELPGIVRPIEQGSVVWPESDSRVMAFIYDRPAGATLINAFARRQGRGFDVDTARCLLRPLLQALRLLAEARLPHRGIRPDNLWFLSAEDGAIALGDMVSGPPGADQPLAYEPVERALAMRAGRGTGTVADDIYALGVTLLGMTIGRDASTLQNEQELLDAKIEKGSYLALTAGLRIPSALADPLRGMLGDDPSERWSLRDVEAWLDGRRPATRVSRARRPAEVSFVFAGRACPCPRSIALAFSRNVAEASRALRGGAVDNWMLHGLHDPPLAKQLTVMIASATGSDEALVARACQLLDPEGPVRYRGFSFQPDGFGPALAQQILTGGSIQAAAEVLMMRLAEPREAVMAATRAADDKPRPAEAGAKTTGWVAPASVPFSILATYVRNNDLGYGMERVLYETNRALPCLSPMLRKHYVADLRSLLPALEAVAVTPDAGARPIDRHIVAFFAARAREQVTDVLAAIADPDPAASVAGVLSLLVWVLVRHPEASLSKLTNWSGRMMGPVIASFRHHATRSAVEKEVQKAIADGDLRRLYSIAKDADRRQRDHEGFEKARQSYDRLTKEIARLEKSQSQRQRISRQIGLQSAAAISCLAGAVSICLTLMTAVR